MVVPRVPQCGDNDDNDVLPAIKMWDVGLRRCIRSITTDASPILTARMNAKEDRVVYGTADGAIRAVCCPEGFFATDHNVRFAQEHKMDDASLELLKPTQVLFQRDSRCNNIIHSVISEDFDEYFQLAQKQLLILLEKNPMVSNLPKVMLLFDALFF